VYHLSVFVHIVSAIVWLGGAFFLALVVVPVAKRLPPTERSALVAAVGSRFRVVGWTCLVLLVGTGVVNLGYRGVTWDSIVSGALLESTFGRLVAAKLALVVAMLAVSAAHDFIVGPASTRAHATAGAAPPPEVMAQMARLRGRAVWLARFTTLLALAVVAVAVALVRGLPW
jgi:copper resistance protein D